MSPLRRTVSVLLAAALLLGAAPQSSFAQVARVAVGETGSMPVTPVGNAAVLTGMAPALNLGAASLDGSFSPSIAPAPSAVGAPVGASAASGQVNPAGPALASPLAAAAKPEDNLPTAPKAAAPSAARKSWSERIGSWLGRKPAAQTQEPKSGEAAKLDADALFDGLKERPEANDGVAASAGDIEITRRSLQSRISGRLAASHAQSRSHVDEFGGPLAEPMNFKQRVGYGLRQGLNLVGIGAILEVTLKPVLNLFPWPQYLSDQTLRGFGRVALLTKYGPGDIATGLAEHPATFLGLNLPMAVTMEEITYRLLGFGLTFLILAAIRPFSRWVASMIGGLPDAAGAVGGTKKVLRIGDFISHFAFPIAAVLSSFNFAVAHFATWGFSPFILALNAILGLFLAHTAYKSRSLTSPILAHLVFNLVTMGAILVGLSFSPLAANAYVIIAGLLGVASLIYGYLMNRKIKKHRVGLGGKALVALMIAGASLFAFNGGNTGSANLASNRATVSAAIVQVQSKTETAPAAVRADTTKAAPADSAAIESVADMVARVKPAVVNPIIHMGQGYALGSGFILSPDGVFVTNGHVVGSKQPGEFINARVPGIPGELKAKVLAVNHDKDLAIVQLQPRPDGKPWPTVKLASQAPREGEEVIAMGYPRGLGFSVSAGVLSALDGRGNMYVKHLQTDAAINPGNSGGPLFNRKGEVIGVNTQIYTQSGGSEGLGFAIQAPEVAHIMAQFAATGNIATASLGIIANLSDPQAPEAGLEIEYVRHGSAAEKAGLLRGDLIIGVGDATIEEGGQEAAGHIAAALSKMVPGQKVTVVVLRGDSPKSFELVADAKATVAPSH
ncbi:MAG: trypsin-like peptidase domain-containing protein [Elusimicrobia bacterium]|nr:trypsin-like peptidase domain-containing protein [Elusimicrobiota bacterium]